jgi:DNA-binding transcriptional ArsR family regulator
MSFEPEAAPVDLAGAVDLAAAPAARPEPGTAENPLRLTDPRAMRGLAHPARIAILEHLALDGPATATECAAVTKLSPSACSYHLRALARYGFAEEDPDSAADGRHRPWRAKVTALTIADDPAQPTATRAAGRVLTDSVQARIAQARERFAGQRGSYPPDWQAATGLTQDYLHVTAAELESLRRDVLELVGRYRRLDPAERPEGARRVLALVEMIPAFGPEPGR